MVERRPIIAHCRSASGPDLTRFALDFARHSGGDLLWIAYVPESVRGWFGRFADSVDPTRSAGCPFRLARLFAAPSSDDLKALLDRVEARRASGADVAAPTPVACSAEVARVADEIDRGQSHVTGLLLDIHHVPTFARQLRPGVAALPETERSWRTRPGVAETASLNVIAILRRCRAANLNVIVATVESSGATFSARSPSPDDAAAVLAAIDEEADLTLEQKPGARRQNPEVDARTDAIIPERLRRGSLRVCRSRYPELPAGTDVAEGDWDALLTAIRPPVPWTERLARAYPRDEIPGLREVRESAASWSDPVQDEFVRVATRRGWTVTRASGEQDRGEHWDVCIERGRESYRVDVKARSKIRRRDPLPQDLWHWVELRGIVDDGWLFGGKADVIAFQTGDSFILVRRDDLAAHVRYHVDPEDVVADPRRSEYRVYHRRDRGGSARATGSDRGVLTLIPTGRLRRLAWEEWSSDVAMSDE